MTKKAPEMDAFAADEFKNKLAQTLGQLYFEQGISALVERIDRIMDDCEDRGYSIAYKCQIRGECTEILLQARLRELQKLVQPSLTVKGLCFKKRGTELTTELDISFFTPKRIYLFECKCYVGDKTLTDKGLLKNRYNEVDVHRQSVMHRNYLHTLIDHCLASGIPMEQAYQLVFVDGSDGICDDTRTVAAKKELPHLEFKNLNKYLLLEAKGLRAYPDIWNIPAMLPILKYISDNSDEMMKIHLKRLREVKRD